jgi:hypothetical protein
MYVCMYDSCFGWALCYSSLSDVNLCFYNTVKVKAIPLQALAGPEMTGGTKRRSTKGLQVIGLGATGW